MICPLSNGQSTISSSIYVLRLINESFFTTIIANLENYRKPLFNTYPCYFLKTEVVVVITYFVVETMVASMHPYAYILKEVSISSAIIGTIFIQAPLYTYGCMNSGTERIVATFTNEQTWEVVLIANHVAAPR